VTSIIIVSSSVKENIDNLHIDCFLKVADASVNSSEIVERTGLGLRHVTDIKIHRRKNVLEKNTKKHFKNVKTWTK